MVNKISSVLAPVGLAFQGESTACPEVAGGWPRGLLAGGSISLPISPARPAPAQAKPLSYQALLIADTVMEQVGLPRHL